MCATLAYGGDGLGGAMSGKARKLADEGAALMKKADKIFRAFILDTIPKEELKAQIVLGLKLYDDGAAKLQKALDISEDGATIHRLNVGARRLQKLRFFLHFRLKPQTKPKPQVRPKAKPKPKPRPEGNVPEPEPEPEPAPLPRPTAEAEAETEAPPPRVEFRAHEPPARPVFVALAEPGFDDAYKAEMVKRDKKAIAALLQTHFASRKPNKLTLRHKLCRGKGTFRDGTECEECCATGKQINLYRFRKAFWHCYSPMLRDSAGALEALRAFHAHATKNPAVLGPAVKSFKLVEIDHHGFWAKVTVALSTTEGKSSEAYTLVGVGSRWFFYHPGTDAELVPKG